MLWLPYPFIYYFFKGFLLLLFLFIVPLNCLINFICFIFIKFQRSLNQYMNQHTNCCRPYARLCCAPYDEGSFFEKLNFCPHAHVNNVINWRKKKKLLVGKNINLAYKVKKYFFSIVLVIFHFYWRIAEVYQFTTTQQFFDSNKW